MNRFFSVCVVGVLTLVATPLLVAAQQSSGDSHLERAVQYVAKIRGVKYGPGVTQGADLTKNAQGKDINKVWDAAGFEPTYFRGDLGGRTLDESLKASGGDLLKLFVEVDKGAVLVLRNFGELRYRRYQATRVKDLDQPKYWYVYHNIATYLVISARTDGSYDLYDTANDKHTVLQSIAPLAQDRNFLLLYTSYPYRVMLQGWLVRPATRKQSADEKPTDTSGEKQPARDQNADEKKGTPPPVCSWAGEERRPCA